MLIGRRPVPVNEGAVQQQAPDAHRWTCSPSEEIASATMHTGYSLVVDCSLVVD